MVEEERIRAIERSSMHGLPALRTVDLHGWVLRFSDGYTNRANSINPLTPPTIDIKSLISQCELLYRSQRLPSLFKLTDAAQPKDLDTILENSGYRQYNPLVHIQTTNIDNLPTSEWEQSIIEERNVSFSWIITFARMNHLSPKHLNTLSRMLQGIRSPSNFIRIVDHGKTVACGYGVIDDGYLGLFDILVDKSHRRQGIGERIVNHLMEWGKEQGAKSAYLQVVGDNEPAVQLYCKLGFTTLYRYWYRIKYPWRH